MEKVINEVGRPHNYGPTPEEIDERRRIAEEKKVYIIYIYINN